MWRSPYEVPWLYMLNEGNALERSRDTNRLTLHRNPNVRRFTDASGLLHNWISPD